MRLTGSGRFFKTTPIFNMSSSLGLDAISAIRNGKQRTIEKIKIRKQDYEGRVIRRPLLVYRRIECQLIYVGSRRVGSGAIE